MTAETRNLDTLFSEAEKRGVGLHFGTPWADLSDSGKLLRGYMYRHSLSPEALAKQIVGDSDGIMTDEHI